MNSGYSVPFSRLRVKFKDRFSTTNLNNQSKKMSRTSSSFYSLLVFSVVFISICVISYQSEVPAPEIPFAGFYPGFRAYIWAEDLEWPRQITRLPNNDILVLESYTGNIILYWDVVDSGVSSLSKRVTLTHLEGLNHAVFYHKDYIYASTESAVYRWPYTLGNHYPLSLGDPQILVEDIPGGGHVTRTIAFDSEDNLYVMCGSLLDVDSTSWRSRVYRYPLSEIIHSPANWSSGT